MATIVHKRGDTFACTNTLKDAAGAAVNLTGTTIKAEIRDSSGTLVQLLTTTLLTQSGATLGQYTLTCPYATTASWALGLHACDVQYTFGDGTRRSTATFTVQVVEDITSA